jgi:hypothetical protein
MIRRFVCASVLKQHAQAGVGTSSMFMKQAHAARASSSDMQHGNDALNGITDMYYEHAAATYCTPSINSMDLQQRRAARTVSMDVQNGRAARTCVVDMHHGYRA